MDITVVPPVDDQPSAPTISVSVTPPEDGLVLLVPNVPESPNKSRRANWETKHLPAFDLTTDKTQCPAREYSKTTVHVRDGGYLAEPMLVVQHKEAIATASKPRQLTLPPAFDQHYAIEPQLDGTPNSPRRPETPTISVSGDEEDDVVAVGDPSQLRRHTLGSFSLDEQVNKKSERRSSSSSIGSGAAGLSLNLPGSPTILVHSHSTPLSDDFSSPTTTPVKARHSWSPPQSPPSSPESRRMSSSFGSPKTYLALPAEKDSNTGKETLTEREKLILSLRAQQPKIPSSIRVRAKVAAKESASAPQSPVSLTSTLTSSPPHLPRSSLSPQHISPQSPNINTTTTNTAIPTVIPTTSPTTTNNNNSNTVSLPFQLPHNWPQLLDQGRVLLILFSLLFVQLHPPTFALLHILGVIADLTHVAIKTSLHNGSNDIINPWMSNLAQKFSTPILMLTLASLVSYSRPLLSLCLVCSIASQWTGSIASLLCPSFKSYPMLPSSAIVDNMVRQKLSPISFAMSVMQDEVTLPIVRAGHEMFLAASVVVASSQQQSGLDLSYFGLLLLTLPCFVAVSMANGLHLLAAIEALSNVEAGKIAKLKSQ